mmetsp:Transcript_16361/g.36050  ORF Transcript_16361/g.36050 Transcript_16361/m.36050 type:complete len:147 (-) Transcript_16361:884-1324(-)
MRATLKPKVSKGVVALMTFMQTQFYFHSSFASEPRRDLWADLKHDLHGFAVRCSGSFSAAFPAAVQSLLLVMASGISGRGRRSISAKGLRLSSGDLLQRLGDDLPPDPGSATSLKATSNDATCGRRPSGQRTTFPNRELGREGVGG